MTNFWRGLSHLSSNTNARLLTSRSIMSDLPNWHSIAIIDYELCIVSKNIPWSLPMILTSSLTYQDALGHVLRQDLIGPEELDEQLVHHQLLAQLRRQTPERLHVPTQHAKLHHFTTAKKHVQVNNISINIWGGDCCKVINIIRACNYKTFVK